MKVGVQCFVATLVADNDSAVEPQRCELLQRQPRRNAIGVTLAGLTRRVLEVNIENALAHVLDCPGRRKRPKLQHTAVLQILRGEASLVADEQDLRDVLRRGSVDFVPGVYVRLCRSWATWIGCAAMRL